MNSVNRIKCNHFIKSASVAALLVSVSATQAETTPQQAYLPLETALKAATTTMEKCTGDGYRVSVAVVDRGGNLLAFNRMDDAMLSSANIAMDKSFTCVFSKRSTKACGEVVTRGGLIPLFLHERWITFPGGYPIISDGIIVGGVGVSGGTFEDTYVARAMLRAGGFDTEEADAYLARIESGEKG